MRQIIAYLSGGTRKPKAKELEVYQGERHKLRGWLAQLIVYYRTVGWQNSYDEEKILYATSLLRDDAGTWITPYAEERITPIWDNWAGFKAELQRQCGVIDAKGEARIRLKKIKQGKRSVTGYWNEFCLQASEAELDYSTRGELLLGGMITELQNAWGTSREEYEDLEALAQWAIRKETKLVTVRHIQGSPSTKNVQRETITPRNIDGTYRPTNNGNQNYGDFMELDATRRRPRFNISRRRIPKEDPRTTVPQMRTTWTLSQELPERRTDPNHSTHKPGVGNPGTKSPLGKPDLRLGKLRSNRNPNSREMMNVPSKR